MKNLELLHNGIPVVEVGYLQEDKVVADPNGLFGSPRILVGSMSLFCFAVFGPTDEIVDYVCKFELNKIHNRIETRFRLMKNGVLARPYIVGESDPEFFVPAAN